ncbi:hypothetical protein BKA70DRAFT_1400259 [Coprinopsis sp. MPI-PUGE-AT-0042]|nr:hypothetical protein BKA70DRAFT_1400259 [Coprinopsis sp. MPI-PUGE-AT-0042]
MYCASQIQASNIPSTLKGVVDRGWPLLEGEISEQAPDSRESVARWKVPERHVPKPHFAGVCSQKVPPQWVDYEGSESNEETPAYFEAHRNVSLAIGALAERVSVWPLPPFLWPDLVAVVRSTYEAQGRKGRKEMMVIEPAAEQTPWDLETSVDHCQRLTKPSGTGVSEEYKPGMGCAACRDISPVVVMRPSSRGSPSLSIRLSGGFILANPSSPFHQLNSALKTQQATNDFVLVHPPQTRRNLLESSSRLTLSPFPPKAILVSQQHKPVIEWLEARPRVNGSHPTEGKGINNHEPASSSAWGRGRFLRRSCSFGACEIPPWINRRPRASSPTSVAPTAPSRLNLFELPTVRRGILPPENKDAQDASGTEMCMLFQGQIRWVTSRGFRKQRDGEALLDRNTRASE